MQKLKEVKVKILTLQGSKNSVWCTNRVELNGELFLVQNICMQVWAFETATVGS